MPGLPRVPGAGRRQVRKTPSWPRSWADSSNLQLCSHRNAWANLHPLGQPDTCLARSTARAETPWGRRSLAHRVTRPESANPTYMFGTRTDYNDSQLAEWADVVAPRLRATRARLALGESVIKCKYSSRRAQ